MNREQNQQHNDSTYEWYKMPKMAHINLTVRSKNRLEIAVTKIENEANFLVNITLSIRTAQWKFINENGIKC